MACGDCSDFLAFILASFFSVSESLCAFAYCESLHTKGVCIVCGGVGVLGCGRVCDSICERNSMGTRELNDILLAHTVTLNSAFHAHCLLTDRKKRKSQQHATLSFLSRKICSQELSLVCLQVD